MKKLEIIGGLLLVATNAFGDAALIFNNRVIGAVVAPVYGVNPSNPGLSLHGNATTNSGAVNYTGCPLLSGTGFTAGLWAAPGGTTDPGAFIPLTPTVPFRTAANLAGIVQQPVVQPVVPPPIAPVDPEPPKPVAIQMRVWDNAGGTVTTWEAVLARPDLAKGSSDVFIINMIDDVHGGQNLIGLQSFNINMASTDPGPGFTQQPQDLVLAPGESGAFSASAASSPPATYQWRFNGEDIPGSTSSSLAIVNAAYTNAGDYMVVATANALSATSRVARLTIRPVITITAQPEDAMTAPASNATFSIAFTAKPAGTVQWRRDGADIAGATGETLALSSVQHADGGGYSAVVSADSLSVTSRVALLSVQPVIVAIEHQVFDPWGVAAARLTYDSTPGRAVQVEGKTTPPGLTWETLETLDNNVVRGYFYDIFATNRSRMYRLKLQ